MTNGGHIDRALTNMSVAYTQAPNAYIADKVFPVIPVMKRSDTYFRYSKGDFFRDEMVERAKAAESAGGDFNMEEADPYYCRRYAFHYDITAEDKANYDLPLNVDRDAVQWLTEKAFINRENKFASKFIKAGIWSRDITGTTTGAGTNETKKFTDATSDPVVLVNNLMLEMAENTGKKPNFLIMAPDVFYALKNHDAIMERIKYTQKGIITIDLIASLFEVDQIFVPWAIQNKGAVTAGVDATKDDMNFIYKGCMLLGNRATSPSLKTATAGYIFAWTGLEGSAGYGQRIVRLPMDNLGLGTERIEIESCYDLQLICKDMGIFLKDLV